MISDINKDSALGLTNPYCPPLARYCPLKKGENIIKGIKAGVKIPMLSLHVVKLR